MRILRVQSNKLLRARLDENFFISRQTLVSTYYELIKFKSNRLRRIPRVDRFVVVVRIENRNWVYTWQPPKYLPYLRRTYARTYDKLVDSLWEGVGDLDHL